MAIDSETHETAATRREGRRSELAVFLILAVLIWPFIAVAVVGGYGFLVWMWQIMIGPPGPPG
jgi:periplasmic nitrate reductase NapE